MATVDAGRPACALNIDAQFVLPVINRYHLERIPSEKMSLDTFIKRRTSISEFSNWSCRIISPVMRFTYTW